MWLLQIAIWVRIDSRLVKAKRSALNVDQMREWTEKSSVSCDTFPMTHDTRDSHLKQLPRNRGDCSRRCQVFTNHRGIAGASLKDAEVGSRKKSNFRRGGNPRRLADVTCRWTNPVYFRVPRGPYQLVP